MHSGALLRVNALSVCGMEADDGVFQVPYAVAGNYTVEGTAGLGNGSARAYAMEVGPENPSPEVTLHMPPMGSVAVRLTRKAKFEGKQERESILIRQKGVGWFATQLLDGQGEARFDHLVEGTYVVGRHAGPWWLPFRGDSVEVDVKAFETTEVTLVVPDE